MIDRSDLTPANLVGDLERGWVVLQTPKQDQECLSGPLVLKYPPPVSAPRKSQKPGKAVPRVIGRGVGRACDFRQPDETIQQDRACSGASQESDERALGRPATKMLSGPSFVQVSHWSDQRRILLRPVGEA